MIITLLGYMGSGKSTIGRELAKLLGYTFIDLDDFIEEKENKSIKEIFKDSGEIYFRKKEIEYLKEIVTLENRLVLSLGGGTPCYFNNIELINNHSKSFYLKVSIQELSKRLFKDKDLRPLINHLNTEEALKEFIGIHLFERNSFYSKAKETISTDKDSVDQTVKKIIANLY